MSYLNYALIVGGALLVSAVVGIGIGFFIHAGAPDRESTPIDVEVER